MRKNPQTLFSIERLILESLVKKYGKPYKNIKRAIVAHTAPTKQKISEKMRQVSAEGRAKNQIHT